MFKHQIAWVNRETRPFNISMESTSEVNGVGLSNYMPMKNLPPSATTPLSNSFMGCAKVLSYILLAIAVLALAASGFAIHTVVEGSPNAALTPSVVLMSGSCDHIDLWRGGIGLLVNIIAGVCLSISTYMQQLCTSPTHEDIAREMKERGDVIFGANSPISLFIASKDENLFVFCGFFSSLHLYRFTYLRTALLVSHKPGYHSLRYQSTRSQPIFQESNSTGHISTAPTAVPCSMNIPKISTY